MYSKNVCLGTVHTYILELCIHMHRYKDTGNMCMYPDIGGKIKETDRDMYPVYP